MVTLCSLSRSSPASPSLANAPGLFVMMLALHIQCARGFSLGFKTAQRASRPSVRCCFSIDDVPPDVMNDPKCRSWILKVWQENAQLKIAIAQKEREIAQKNTELVLAQEELKTKRHESATAKAVNSMRDVLGEWNFPTSHCIMHIAHSMRTWRTWLMTCTWCQVAVCVHQLVRCF